MPALLATLHPDPQQAASASLKGWPTGCRAMQHDVGCIANQVRRRKPLAIVGYFITAWAWQASPRRRSGGTCFWARRRVAGAGRGHARARKPLLAEATTPRLTARVLGLEQWNQCAGMAVRAAVGGGFDGGRQLVGSSFGRSFPACLPSAASVFLVHERPHEPHRKLRLGKPAIAADRFRCWASRASAISRTRF